MLGFFIREFLCCCILVLLFLTCTGPVLSLLKPWYFRLQEVGRKKMKMVRATRRLLSLSSSVRREYFMLLFPSSWPPVDFSFVNYFQMKKKRHVFDDAKIIVLIPLVISLYVFPGNDNNRLMAILYYMYSEYCTLITIIII